MQEFSGKWIDPVEAESKKASMQAFAILFLIFSWMIWIPEYFTQTTRIPDLPSLQVTEGVASFAEPNPKRGRALLVTDTAGTVRRFECRDSVAARYDCGVGPIDGQRVTVRWYVRTLDIGVSVQRPVQIEVEKKVVLPYATTVDNLRRQQASGPWVSAILFLLGWYCLSWLGRRRAMNRYRP